MISFWKENFYLKAFALTKVPLILFTGAKIKEMTDDKVAVEIPFAKRNRNHLGSMYFGTLCVGADVAGGFLAMKILSEVKTGKGSLAFKDFKADFLKRPEGPTLFVCNDGPQIRAAVAETAKTGERINLPVEVIATVPSIDPNEPVARFVLTLSVKVRAES